MLKKYRILVVCTCVITLVLSSLVATVSLAATPSKGNIIYGAYQKVNGMLRIINDPSEAKPSEEVISWNKEGAPGQPGPGYGVHYLSIGPAAFHEEKPAGASWWNIDFGSVLLMTPGTEGFSANVSLPEGAVVKEVRFCFREVGAYTVILEMWRGDLSINDYIKMCEFTVLDHQDGIRCWSTTTILNNVIDNEHYFYTVRCHLQNIDGMSNCPYIKGVRIKYELTVP